MAIDVWFNFTADKVTLHTITNTLNDKPIYPDPDTAYKGTYQKGGGAQYTVVPDLYPADPTKAEVPFSIGNNGSNTARIDVEWELEFTDENGKKQKVKYIYTIDVHEGGNIVLNDGSVSSFTTELVSLVKMISAL